MLLAKTVAPGFTVWSQVDITLCQQQCVVTHLVSHTRKVRIGSFGREMAAQLVFCRAASLHVSKLTKQARKPEGETDSEEAHECDASSGSCGAGRELAATDDWKKLIWNKSESWFLLKQRTTEVEERHTCFSSSAGFMTHLAAMQCVCTPTCPYFWKNNNIPCIQFLIYSFKLM